MTTREIVVGLAEDASASAVLHWAVEQATLTDARLRVVHVWDAPMADVFTSTASVREAREGDARARATHTVNNVLNEMSVRTPWVLDIVEGAPGPALVDRSRSADLLVLGTQGHVGLRRAVARSVSHYVLSHARCPVVAVPPQVRVPVQGTAPRPAAAPVTTPGPLL
ncbi:MAG: universal stress protein [Actinomycetes bacterium]